MEDQNGISIDYPTDEFEYLFLWAMNFGNRNNKMEWAVIEKIINYYDEPEYVDNEKEIMKVEFTTFEMMIIQTIISRAEAAKKNPQTSYQSGSNYRETRKVEYKNFSPCDICGAPIDSKSSLYCSKCLDDLRPDPYSYD